MAKETAVVMDGRDIGTVVLPDADVKVYLTASSRVRAERRMKDYLGKGQKSPSLEELIREIEERDERDMTREESPLRQAEDAVLIDSSDMTIDEVVGAILKLAGR
jgi:cytidylate kinase